MKWKITGQFLVIIIITMVTIVQCLWLVNAVHAIYLMQKNKGDKEVEYFDKSVHPTDFTASFAKKIQWKNNEIIVDDKYLKNIKDNNIWIQVLDENGTEIYNRYKPSTYPTHYIPGELVSYHLQSGTIKGHTFYTKVIQSEGRSFTYILGYPGLKTDRIAFSFSHETLLQDVFKIGLIVLIVTIIISALAGYVFSFGIAGPMVTIIDGIQLLAKGNNKRKYVEKGLYKEVYQSLNNLSETLESNESERMKTEKMREEWIANITHDLKTPLSSIKGYSEVLLEEEYKITMEECQKYAEVILGKANYMEGLVEDLKLTYQLKNSLMPLNKKQTNLVDLLRETVIDILNHPKYEHAPIDFRHTADVIMFNCDGTLLQRAFANIIYNALIHNDEGTGIEVEINSGKGIKIEIADNGKGIPEEYMEKLFERYYRGTSTGEAHKGSGLGLAIARQIVEAHGGVITVKSTLNVGTTVTICFN